MQGLALQASRRDFFALTSSVMGAIGLGGVGWVMLDSMNPAAGANSYEWYDFQDLLPGKKVILTLQQMDVVMIHRLTDSERVLAEGPNTNSRYPGQPVTTTQKAGWVVARPYCTRYYCRLIDFTEDCNELDYFCPCCGSHFDIAGRVLRGPAPRNLESPPYRFESESEIRFGRPLAPV